MIEFWLFTKGLAIGVAVAAPVGPVGALCIRRALSHGRLSAIATGFGAAMADAFYGAVAAFGLTAISDFLVQYQRPAAAIGGTFLIYLSFRIFRAQRQQSVIETSSGKFSLLAGFITTFLLTLTNPATILSFAAIFAGIGFLQNAPQAGGAISLVGGVFLGSALWWVVLAFAAHEMKRRLGGRFEYFVAIISASIIASFGIVALVSLFF